MFLTIAEIVIKRNGVVVGAAFDTNNVVRHIAVDNISELKKLQNSKYVQSDIGDIYCVVKDLLINKKLVLFSGTPCQVAGLYAFLDSDYNNLITADIICHGCPSPKLLKRQLEEESKSKKGVVKSVSFRYKNPIFKTRSQYVMRMRMTHGLSIVRRPKDDPFFNIFLKGYGFRESCYKCPFALPDRVGDFTLGDCDSQVLYKEFHPNESNSTVIVNSYKARLLWDEYISKMCDYERMDICEEIKLNKQLRRPFERPEIREDVYRDLDSMNWNDFAKKYANKQNGVGWIKSQCSLLLPNSMFAFWAKLHGRL